MESFRSRNFLNLKKSGALSKHPLEKLTRLILTNNDSFRVL